MLTEMWSEVVFCTKLYKEAVWLMDAQKACVIYSEGVYISLELCDL